MTTIPNILDDLGKKLVRDTQKALRDNDINASGNLSRSVNYTVSESRDIAALDVKADDYIFPAVQEGEPPKRGVELISLPETKKWMIDKPVRFSKSQINFDSLAFLIKNSINTKGTQKWQEFGSKGKTSGILEGVFNEKLIDKAQEEITDSVLESTIEIFAQFSNLE